MTEMDKQKLTQLRETLTKTQQDMIKALERNLGLVTYACKEVDITPYTHYDWYKNYPIYKLIVDSVEDIVLDFAERSLHSQILEKNPSSTQFYLRHKGRKRGYVEKHQLEVSGGLDINVQQLTDDQLQALAKGESISGVGATQEKKGEDDV